MNIEWVTSLFELRSARENILLSVIASIVFLGLTQAIQILFTLLRAVAARFDAHSLNGWWAAFMPDPSNAGRQIVNVFRIRVSGSRVRMVCWHYAPYYKKPYYLYRYVGCKRGAYMSLYFEIADRWLPETGTMVVRESGQNLEAFSMQYAVGENRVKDFLAPNHQYVLRRINLPIRSRRLLALYRGVFSDHAVAEQFVTDPKSYTEGLRQLPAAG
jgi:hypothetical protein